MILMALRVFANVLHSYIAGICLLSTQIFNSSYKLRELKPSLFLDHEQ